MTLSNELVPHFDFFSKFLNDITCAVRVVDQYNVYGMVYVRCPIGWYNYFNNNFSI